MTTVDAPGRGVRLIEPRSTSDGMFRLSEIIATRHAGTWARYSWNLQRPIVSFDPFPYRIRQGEPRELQLMLKVVLASYASDPAWEPLAPWIESRMHRRVSTTLGGFRTAYLVAERGGRIVGVCGVADSHWSGSNFLTGVCLTPDHLKERLGGALLTAALLRLRQFGLQQATASARTGSRDDLEYFPVANHRREGGGPWPI
jgi:GNAT superfamily N-acetyltransferase